MAIKLIEFSNQVGNVPLRVAQGHFATSHSHLNYYIDFTMTKHRLSEAREAAAVLCSKFKSSTIIDTILCLDGTEVIGACFASKLSEGNYINMNSHKTIYVVTPETTGSNQLLFRDNIIPMIKDKHVMILAVSVASGKTVEAAVDAVNYYGGSVSGISAIFSTAKECRGLPVRSVFDPNDIPGYTCCPAHECPMCKAGQKLDALVNSHGFSKI